MCDLPCHKEHRERLKRIERRIRVLFAFGLALITLFAIAPALIPDAEPERVQLLDRSHHSTYQRPQGMSDGVYAALHHASAEWNVPLSTMARVSRCESTWNPAARSRSGRYLGLFQHHRSYWRDRVRNFNRHVALHNSREPNQLDPMAGDPYAAIDNARVTAWMVQHKTGWRPWSCK